MKKTTKGALASGAAAVLLLGGAGSLAYWNATATVNGGSVTTGRLTLAAGTCDANWVYNGTTTAITTIVPGDAITKTCNYTIGAAGDHLSATVSAPATTTFTRTGGTNGSPSAVLNVATTYSLNRTPAAALVNGDKITSADDTRTLTARFVVTMPYGTAPGATGTAVNVNDTQGLTATLDGLTVTLTQDRLAANPNP